jgi:hypothetical protein
MPLQDMPQTFSSMQFWQILKPQRQAQQKGATVPQQWHSTSRARRCFRRYGELTEESGMIALDAAVHHDVDAGGREQIRSFPVFISALLLAVPRRRCYRQTIKLKIKPRPTPCQPSEI